MALVNQPGGWHVIGLRDRLVVQQERRHASGAHFNSRPVPIHKDRLLVDQSPEKHRSVLYDLNRVKFRQTLSAPKRFQGKPGFQAVSRGVPVCGKTD